MADGIFIKILPQLEVAALSSVVTQLKNIMGKAGADISKSMTEPQKALEELNAATIKTTEAVSAASAKLDALNTQAARSSEARANAEEAAAERQAKATRAIEVAEERLEGLRDRNFANQATRQAAEAKALKGLYDAEAAAAEVSRDNALRVAAAYDAEAAALGRVTKAEAEVTAARDAHTASLAAHTAALEQSTGALGKYGAALGTIGMAATGAFAAVGAVGIDAATKFQTGMARIQVAGQVSTQQVQQLSQGLLDMSANMGVSMDKLQEASLMISKAGPQYKDAADNLKILNAGIELSKTEGADLTTVVQQMTTSMTDFSMGAGQAGDIAAKFQAAAANAKRPLEEFVGALHNIEPAAMGVLDQKTGLNQVLTVMSQMAGTGAGIDQASQNLNNMLTHLDTPNSPQRNILEALGVDTSKIAEQLKAPDGLINVLGELREAMQKATTGTGDNAITHLGFAFNNPQVKKLMDRDYQQLAPEDQGLADRLLKDQAAGIEPDKDTLRQVRQAKGGGGFFPDWYTKFLQTTGASNLVKQGIDPDMAPSAAIEKLTGSQAAARSFMGTIGDVSNPDDQHWANTQATYKQTQDAKADPNGNIPGWDAIKDTTRQKLDEFEGSFHKLAIEVGEVVLPAFNQFLTAVTDITKFLGDNKAVLDTLVITLGLVATGWLAVKANMMFDRAWEWLSYGLELTAQKAESLVGNFRNIATESALTAQKVEETSVAESESLAKVEGAAGKVQKAVGLIGGAAKGALAAFLLLKPYIDEWDQSLKDHKFDPSNDPNHVYTDANGNITPEQWENRASGDKEEEKRRSEWIMKNLAPKLGPNATEADLLKLEEQPFDAPWGIDKQGIPKTYDDYQKGLADRPGWGMGAPAIPGTDTFNRGLGRPGSADQQPAPASDAPTGKADDPVQVQIPGFDPTASTSSFDPSSVTSDMASGMGLDLGGDSMSGMSDMSGGLGGGAIQNPLEQLKGGGFTLANIAKVLTTFLMEMALGNPLGHLLTGTSMFGGDQADQGGADASLQIGDIDNMTAGQRKQAEMELQTQAALLRYKKAQAAYVKIITKYGANSEQGISAYANLLSAKDGVEGLALRQTDEIDKGNEALSQAQATLAQDKTDQLDISDPQKYAHDQAQVKKLQDSLPSGGPVMSNPNPGAGAMGWKQTVADTVAKYGAAAGIPSSQFGNWTQAILRQIDTESKGNPIDVNDHDPDGHGGYQTVSGLLQYLPSTFRDYAGKLTGSTNMMDPIAQIAGALLAAKNPDGSPSGIGNGIGWGPVRQPGDLSQVDQSAPISAPLAPGSPGAGGGPSAAPPAFDDPWKLHDSLARPPAAPPPGSPQGTLLGGSAVTPVNGKPGIFWDSNINAFINSQGYEVDPNTGQRSGPSGDGPRGLKDLSGAGAPAPANAPGALPPVASRAPQAGAPPYPGFASWNGGQGGGSPTQTVLAAAYQPMSPSNTAKSQDAGTGSGVSVGGGVLGEAEGLAATALNGIAPGAGVAAQVAAGELNNLAGYIGKAAGIGVEALQETFTVHSPDGGGGSKGGGGWLSKIAGGLAGAHPQTPNGAGTADPVKPADKPADQQGAAQGTTNNYNVTNNNHGVNDAQGVAMKTNQGLMQYPTMPT